MEGVIACIHRARQALVDIDWTKDGAHDAVAGAVKDLELASYIYDDLHDALQLFNAEVGRFALEQAAEIYTNLEERETAEVQLDFSNK
jgi:hypothetical protein